MSKMKMAAWIVSCLLLASCSSIPKPQGPDSTLLVMKVTTENKSVGGSFGFTYNLDFEGLDGAIFVTPTEQLVIKANLKPGSYRKYVNHFGQYGNMLAQSYPVLSGEAPFQLSAGACTIFPYRFHVYMGDATGSNFVQMYQLIPLTFEEKASILKTLQSSENFASWK